MALLEVHTFPDPVLKKKAAPVTVFDSQLQETADSMLETMYEEKGIGLAAVQVAILKQIVVIDLKSGEEDHSLKEPHVFINPRITDSSGETVTEEGCLSVLDFRAEIQRSEQVRVEYQDLEGQTQEMQADGMMAICLQHELDHLRGILFLDHLPPLRQKMVKKRLAKQAREAA